MSDTSETWVDTTLSILRAVRDSGQWQSVDIDSVFRVPGDADFYSAVMADLWTKRVDDELTSLYLPTLSPADIVKELTGNIVTSGFGNSGSVVVRQMVKVPAEWPWEVLVKSAAEALQVPSNISNDQLGACLEVLLILEEIPEADAKTALANTVQGGYVLHHLEYARAAPDLRAIALCVLAQLRTSPDGDYQTAVGDSPQGQQWYRNFAETPDPVGHNVIEFLTRLVSELWNGTELLLTGRDYDVAAPIVARVVEELVALEQFHFFVPAKAIVDGFSFIEKHLAPTRDALLVASNKNGTLIVEVLKTQFSADLCGLYEWGLAQESTRDALLPYVEAGMADISRDEWLSELNDSGCLLNITMLLVQIGRSPLSTPFSDALLDEARTVLENTAAFPEGNRRGNLAGALTEESRGVFYKNLRDTLVDHGSRSLSAVLEQYGHDLDSSLALDDPTAADQVVRRVLGEIVGRQVGEELRWAVDAVQHHPVLMESCDSATANLVRDRLRAALETPSEGSIAPYLTTLATTLGVDTSGISEAEPE